ncbi:hypothetical protein TcWFU_009078 [Taenia crassiceps]|uniref:Uncharacterized protein n=1 Tax=Taenia crassiceps TaxID=6207 RepID=A0ABR4PZI7_9CEST
MYIASAATSGNECGDSSGSSGPQQGRGVRSLNHWTGDGWAAVHQHQQYLNATPHSSHLRLLGADVLGHSLGALRHRVLGQLTRQQQTHSSLNLPACDCRLLVIMRQPARLSGNPLEDVIHEGVHYRHRLRRDARVRMHLTQHLVDVDGVALLLLLLLLLLFFALSVFGTFTFDAFFFAALPDTTLGAITVAQPPLPRQ